MKLLLVFGVVLLIWIVWGYFSSRVEQAEYTLVEDKGDYEIRNYSAHIVAQTTVVGSYKESLNRGFTIVASYIFGDNTKKEKIAMTSPVLSQNNLGTGENVAMTAPVLVSMEGESHTISFGMPKGYTLETLPIPNDSRVELVEVPDQKMAAIKFSWFRTDTKVQGKTKELLTALSDDNIDVLGAPYYAGYNGPGTPPFMSKHEILVEIK